MSCQRTMCCILAAVAVLTGCNGTTDTGQDDGDTLTGTRWVGDGRLEDGQVLVFKAVDALEGEVVGYAFDEDGELTYRSFGWCATPPLSYFDVTGAWALDVDATLEFAYPGAMPANPLRFEIVRQTREELHLRPLEIEPPAHSFLEGTWEGTYVISGTDPKEGAPARIGPVTFVVEGAEFRLTGEQPLVPPPAQGLLAVGETVVLRDLSFHTADYDWHLNINGHFLWKLQDGELVLHQDMRNRAVAREFRLRRADN